MYTIQEAQHSALKALKSALGSAHAPSIDELEYPKESKMGDLAYPCFGLAKSLKKKPNEIATELAAKIGPKDLIKKVEAKGPYVNFFFDPVVFGEHLLKEIAVAKDKFGNSTSGKGKRIMVEYAQPNTHKTIHVGHLRNFVVGHALINILRAAGYEVIAASYINDLGAHVAKCLWAIEKNHQGEDPADKDALLAKAYVEADKAAEKTKKAKEEMSEIYQELERGSRKWSGLWKKTRKWSLDSFARIFKELGMPIDVTYYESDLTKRTHQIIKDLLKQGIAKESDGAIVVDLEDQDLGVNLLVRTDGTLLYNAKDIALAERKEQDYEPARSIYVIDARQSLAMQQLFATLKLMGLKRNLEHLSYEFVTLKSGAMASRKGNVVKYDDFRDQMFELALAETAKRHQDWTDKQLDRAAKKIAFAAMKFPMLKQDLDKMITFDMKEALSFEGFSGPYILFSIARAKSILKKAEVKPVIKGKYYTQPVEHKLLVKLGMYPEVVLNIAGSSHLSALPQYLFELAQTFSEFYEAVPVLKAESDEAVAAKLALVDATRQVLENGLALLGIESLDEM
ncbi:MAG: arginine--tRNA ligase [Candidatus Uhrbacteria bacterium]|nr:arginine--tRNA ligase [Patescibacteria group bacterium]MBU1907258.1 arginine--tRNA ligase [Patescibacteria group bacterium]